MQSIASPRVRSNPHTRPSRPPSPSPSPADDRARDLAAENRDLREKLATIKRLTFARNLKPGPRLTAIANQLTLWERGGHYSSPVDTLHKRLGISTDTVSQHLHTGQSAGLFDWKNEPVGYRADGTPAEPGERVARWETSSLMFARPLPAEIVPTAEAERTLKNRDAARELQRKLKAIREGICPACGEAGCLSARATCTSCGTIFEAEEHEPPDLENIQVGEKPGIVSVTPRENRAKAGTATETATEALTPPQAAHAPDLENIQIGTVEVFFLQRIGSDPVLVRMNDATGKRRKYLPYNGELQLKQYLAGAPGHLYGSRPRHADGTSWQIEFDIDPKTGTTRAQLEREARELQLAGVASLLWVRSPGSFRLTIPFDAPVPVEAAHAWLLQLAPGLVGLTDECFPALGGDGWENRAAHNLGWPMLYLDEANRVTAAQLFAFYPGGEAFSPGWLAGEGARDAIRVALARCVTAAVMVPEAEAAVLGGISASVDSQQQKSAEALRDGESIVRAAIRWFNTTNTPAALGIPGAGYTSVRDERTPSCHRDYDDYPVPMWTDFGTGKKLDLFEMWLCRKNLDKSEEIKRLVREYRATLTDS